MRLVFINTNLIKNTEYFTDWYCDFVIRVIQYLNFFTY
jgi:hypothetical protein